MYDKTHYNKKKNKKKEYQKRKELNNMICLKWYCECELAMYLFSITLFFSKCICLLMLLIIYNMPREILHVPVLIYLQKSKYMKVLSSRT